METEVYIPTRNKWSLDLVHNELSFKVKHLIISTVTGYFRNFNITAVKGDDFLKPLNIELVPDVASIDTNK